jgi:zinc transport system substrate-binding protein
MLKNKLMLLGLVLAVAGLLAYAHRIGREAPDSGNGKELRIVTSSYPSYYIARRIAGDRAQVTNLIPAGAEPHDYELTPQDLIRIQESRLLILVGSGLETWGDGVRKSIDPERTLLVEAGDGLCDIGAGKQDPHIWLDPLLAAKMAERIGSSIEAVDAVNSSYYEENERALLEELEDLDQEYRQGTAECQERSIVTSHDAFAYMAREYALQQVAIAGRSQEAEPSVQQMAELTDFAKKNRIRYIFFESLASPELSRTLAAEVGAQTLVLNPLEGLTAQEEAQGKDYMTEMRSNLSNLRLALGCR